MTRSHWYWRPGWAVGRRFYTWHVTFSEHDPALGTLVDHYRPVIDSMSHLEKLPESGLHLTTQGVGFTHEVDEANLNQIVDRASRRLAGVSPIEATLGPARTDAEGLFLVVEPLAALLSLRTSLRSAIADVWGADRVPEGEDFSPHVTLAYSDGVVPLDQAQRELERVVSMSAPLVIDHVSLIKLHRDNRRYEWKEIAVVPLGSPA